MTSIKTRIETLLNRIIKVPDNILEEWLPLKQGLKPFSAVSFTLSCNLEEWLPLKQGLKLEQHTINGIPYEPWRMTSIKTRIETSTGSTISNTSRTWRMTSIKTRIETLILRPGTVLAAGLEEWLPLKQGLKRDSMLPGSSLNSLKNDFH